MRKKLFNFIQVFIFLIFLEIFFIMGGMVTQSLQALNNRQKVSAKDSYVIMCIGESLTLVGGEDSYPSQLERILNQAVGQKKFVVINEGAAGQGTYYFSQHIADLIRRNQPDMVISMLGALDPSEAKIRKLPWLLRKVKQLRLYRLAEQINEKLYASLEGFANRFGRSLVFKERSARDSETKEKKLKPDQKICQEMARLFLMADILEMRKENRKAEVIYQRIYDLNKVYPCIDNAFLIKKVCQMIVRQKDYERLISRMHELPYDTWEVGWIKYYCHGEDNVEHIRQAIESIVEKNPEKFIVYGYLAGCYEEAGMKEKAAKYFKMIDDYNNRYYSEFTQTNYGQILGILLTQNIQPVFVQYPMRNVNPLKALFRSKKEFDKILFVDQGPVFQNVVSDENYAAYFTDRTSGDIGHLTKKGNLLMAQTVAEQILNWISLGRL